jgi:nucleoside-diphosphate-sugar epimerase
VVAACGEDPATWPIETGPAQRGDQRRSAARIDAIRAIVGWEPTVDLGLGLTRTVAWATG